MPWLDDVSVGSWIASAQLTEHGRVGSLVPPCFDSYVVVRLSGEHAAVVNRGRALRQHLVRRLSEHGADAKRCIFAISDVYGWDGTVTRGAADLVFERQVTGENDIENLHRKLLEGAIRPTDRPPSSAPALLETRLRDYMLYEGSLHDAGAAARGGGPTEIPDLWWPFDRTWFVATDTDLDVVIVAGPEALTTSLADTGIHTESVGPRSFLG